MFIFETHQESGDERRVGGGLEWKEGERDGGRSFGRGLKYHIVCPLLIAVGNMIIGKG